MNGTEQPHEKVNDLGKNMSYCSMSPNYKFDFYYQFLNCKLNFK